MNFFGIIVVKICILFANTLKFLTHEKDIFTTVQISYIKLGRNFTTILGRKFSTILGLALQKFR